MSLEDALSYTLYKFVFFNKTMNDWAPGGKLTIEPLGESMELPPDHGSFWRGAEAELILERERLKKQREAHTEKYAGALEKIQTLKKLLKTEIE